MQIENYLPHIDLVLKCLDSILNDYGYTINEVENIAINGYKNDVIKFRNEIAPYYQAKKLDNKVLIDITDRNMKKVIDIENLCKKYMIKIWNDVLSDPRYFQNGDLFDFLAYSINLDADSDITAELDKLDEIVLNYITDKNMGLENSNYGIIFSLAEEDLICTSTENIFLEIQQKKDNFFMRLKKADNIQRIILDNKLLFHNTSSALITPKMLKQKIIEKEMQENGTLLGLAGTVEYTNSIVADAKTLKPAAFFILKDGKSSNADIREKFKMYSNIYKIPVIEIDKKTYIDKLDSTYKKNTI